jgi:hypothetical protein
MTANDLVNAGFYGYQGWSDAAAAADYAATGGAGKGSFSGGSSGDPASQYINAAVSAVQKPKPYSEVSPFSFDEALAKEAATAEYAPYYTRLLTDYTSDVERTKSRSSEDMKTTIEQLNAGKEYYTGVQRRALDTSMRQTNEGYAGNGLFFSGVRQRDIKELQTEHQASMENYLGSYKYNVNQAELGNKRTTEDQSTALSHYSRDTEEAKRAAIEANVLQRKNEALTEYGIKQADYYNSANNSIA